MLNDAASATEDLRKARGLVLLASGAFACMYVCVKLLGPGVSSFEVLFARSTVGLVVCLALLRSMRGTARFGSTKLNLARSSFGFLSIASQFVALHEGSVPLSTVAFLRHAAPVWMLMLAGPLLDEWPGRRAKIAVGLGIVGAAIALKPDSASSTWGVALAGVAGLFAALALLSVRKLTTTDHPLTVVTFFMGFVATVTTPIVAWKWWNEGLHWSLRDGALIVAAAVLGTLGQIIGTTAYRYARAVSIAVAALAEVVFTILLGWLVANDAASWTTLVGGAAILAAGWLATSKRRA